MPFANWSGFDAGSAGTTVLDPMTKYVLTEHFDGGTAGTTGGTATANSGSITASTAGDSGHPGILSLGTSTSATAAPTWTRGSLTQFLDGSGALSFDVVFKLSNLSNDDATNTFIIYLGFGNQTNGTEPTNGCYITYSDGVNSGKFVFKTAAASSRTSLNTNVTVAANTWYRAKGVSNTDGSQIDFYLSTDMKNLGTSVGSITTNIPNSGTNSFGVQITMAKTAGTTSRVLYADMIETIKDM